jgi:catechol 2,3-dioxygenase-like lactoylglutathione lyase family enzyme
MTTETVNVRYMVDDVDEALDFYTTHFGFSLLSSAAPVARTKLSTVTRVGTRSPRIA